MLGAVRCVESFSLYYFCDRFLGDSLFSFSLTVFSQGSFKPSPSYQGFFETPIVHTLYLLEQLSFLRRLHRLRLPTV